MAKDGQIDDLPEGVDAGTIELGKLAQKMLHGKNRTAFQRLAIEEEPDLQIPEIHAEKTIAAATKPLIEQNQKLQERLDKRDALEALEARREPAYARGYTGEKLKKLEQFMIDKKIGDYALAIDNFERAEAPEPQYHGGQYEPPTLPVKDKNDPLFKDPRRAASVTAHQLVDQLRQGKPI